MDTYLRTSCLLSPRCCSRSLCPCTPSKCRQDRIIRFCLQVHLPCVDCGNLRGLSLPRDQEANKEGEREQNKAKMSSAFVFSRPLRYCRRAADALEARSCRTLPAFLDADLFCRNMFTILVFVHVEQNRGTSTDC